VFKNRALVTGIGVGIIVGAVLLQVMLIRPSSPSKSGISLEEMDPQKLKEEASKYYLVFEKNVKMYTQAEIDSAVQKKVKEETDKFAASKPQDQPKASPPTVSSKIVIYVQQNLDASTVADLLFQAGVISDRKAFITELDKQGGNTKIQVGYHEFEGKMDMATIVTNLITIQ
jgi:gas vesicle protein